MTPTTQERLCSALCWAICFVWAVVVVLGFVIRSEVAL